MLEERGVGLETRVCTGVEDQPRENERKFDLKLFFFGQKEKRGLEVKAVGNIAYCPAPGARLARYASFPALQARPSPRTHSGLLRPLLRPTDLVATPDP